MQPHNQGRYEWLGHQLLVLAANVLIDLWPGIENCSYLYSEDEAKQIMKAADTIGDLTRNIVKVE